MAAPELDSVPLDPAPWVSVLIPAYNNAGTLGEAVDSLLAQTYRWLEVVVVDDGSTDDTWAVLQSYGDAIRCVRQPNAGIAGARNAGLRESSGEFVALMDADDICEPERIAVQVEFLRRHPEVVLCSSDFSGFDSTGPLAASYCGIYYHQCSQARGGPAARYPHRGEMDVGPALAGRASAPIRVPTYFGRVYEELVHGNFVHPPTVMFRRTLLDAVGQFDTDVAIVCEWDWLVKAARIGDLGYIDRPLLRYRRSGSQISSSPLTSLDSLRVARRICDRDPELYAREGRRIRRHFGELCLDAAGSCAEYDRWQAAALLAQSMLRYATFRRSTPRIALKLMLPAGALAGIRRLRRPAGAP